eukprot:907549-Rhodomonas_salina.1
MCFQASAIAARGRISDAPISEREQSAMRTRRRKTDAGSDSRGRKRRGGEGGSKRTRRQQHHLWRARKERRARRAESRSARPTTELTLSVCACQSAAV